MSFRECNPLKTLFLGEGGIEGVALRFHDDCFFEGALF